MEEISLFLALEVLESLHSQSKCKYFIKMIIDY